MHHKNEVAKIMNDLVKGQGLDIGPEIKRVHELMDDYKNHREKFKCDNCGTEIDHFICTGSEYCPTCFCLK